MKKNYALCDGKTKDGMDCPLKDSCARYLPDMDKTKTIHIAWGPYNRVRNKCGQFEPLEPITEIIKIINGKTA